MSDTVSMEHKTTTKGTGDNMQTIGYYVTCQDAGKTGFLLGPFATHTEACEKVSIGQQLAEAANSRAVFYAYGTSKITSEKEDLPEGLLNKKAENATK